MIDEVQVLEIPKTVVQVGMGKAPKQWDIKSYGCIWYHIILINSVVKIFNYIISSFERITSWRVELCSSKNASIASKDLTKESKWM